MDVFAVQSLLLCCFQMIRIRCFSSSLGLPSIFNLLIKATSLFAGTVKIHMFVNNTMALSTALLNSMYFLYLFQMLIDRSNKQRTLRTWSDDRNSVKLRVTTYM